MIDFFYQIIRTARPRQWLKNFALITPALILGNILDPKTFSSLINGFISFCLISSAAYFVNDIIDAPKDSLHPIKKNRPIPSGKLKVWIAWIISIILMSSAIFYAVTKGGNFFGILLIVYIIIQFIYSLFIRNIIILDSLTVASGFVIRVIAGAVITNISVSSWLILTTIALSLLLAFGKRRSEKTLLFESQTEAETRKTLKNYPDNLLDSMITMSATFCIVAYSLFTFQVSPDAALSGVRKYLPSVIESPKWLMFTIPLVIYGVARYLYVIYEKKQGESPERVLLSDMPLLVTVLIWGVLVLLHNIFIIN
jgi:4-hydroxybenzoate polyprenyltransferase